MNSAIAAFVVIISILLISVAGLQAKGTGSSLFGSTSSSFRTRRGAEKLLFRATIVLVMLLVILSLVNFREFNVTG
jgi:protein translocase SecG subunit